MTRLLTGRKRDPRTERVLFALVANRALDPGSKLAAARWVSRRAHIDGLAETTDDACYRAMNWLIDIASELEKEVLAGRHPAGSRGRPAVLRHHLHLLRDRRPRRAGRAGCRGPTDPRPAAGHHRERHHRERHGRSRGHGGSGGGVPDLRQVEELPRGPAPGRDRHGCDQGRDPGAGVVWPGNTSDSALIRQAREDIRDSTLSRVMWVADRGFSSKQNRRELRRGGGHYIIGEKLRSGSAEANAALSRQGRYPHVRDNLQVKEVKIAEDERFVICYNPEQAERDGALREVMTDKLTTMITDTDTDRLSATKRAELRGRISTMPGLNRFLRITPAGLLCVDKTKITAEAKLDGKYLLSCSDPALSAEDIAQGYKQLLQVERGWRDMKTTLELRPVYHRLEERIRAHVILCWLALLLIRIAETTTSDTWNRLREDLQELHVGTFEGPAGTFRQRTELTDAQRAILSKLNIEPPKKIVELGPPATP